MIDKLRTIVAGNTIMLFYKVYDESHLQAVPMDPNQGVFVTVYDPDGVPKAEQAMTKVTDDPKNPVGLYRYRHISLSGDMKGTWRATCRTVNDAEEDRSEPENAFILQ